MIDLFSLVKQTGAYKTVRGELLSGRLSHAYLILTADGENLDEYLKIFARLMVCGKEHPCFNCRACRLIGENAFSDVVFYPKNGQSINSEDINSLIEESYLKPIEGDKKVFVLSQAQNMNASAQNKLLKTLEEPPEGVHIIIGATSEFPLLATVKSRVKKLEIPPYSADKLFSAMQQDYPDTAKLSSAIACGDGTVGRASALYADEGLKDLTDFCCDMICNMQSSKDVLKYSAKLTALKCEVSDFLSVTELMFRDLLTAKQGREDLVLDKQTYIRIKDAKGYCVGALVGALEKINQAQKRKKFNANSTMLIEWLLFQILEGKYKWQKL